MGAGPGRRKAMGDCCYARLTVREDDLDPDFRDRMKSQGSWESWQRDGRGDDFFSVENSEVVNGRFAWLEEELVKRGIAFDRFTDGYGSFQPRERRYRPGRDGRPAVDVEVVLTTDGEPFVPLRKLHKLLRSGEYTTLQARLYRLVDEAEPVPPLEGAPGDA